MTGSPLVEGFTRRALCAALLTALASCSADTRGRAPEGPRRALYAWNRVERLDGLRAADAAIAVYAATVSLRRGELVWRPRAHAIAIAEGARVIAVVHVEPAPPALTRPLDAALRTFLVERMAIEARRPGVAELQLDYEAPLSERPFLRALVEDLRRTLGPRARLSMTALASWCLEDRWIAGLPVDEAVPMVYRMGRDRERVRAWLDAGHDFSTGLCRHSVAVSLGDVPPRLPPGRRTFWFAPRSWTTDDVRHVLSFDENQGSP